jgi:acyl dehydratase
VESPAFQINTVINEDEIAKARAFIGKPLRVPQYNHEATLDTIRHYAFGVGDDNPLWCDPGYAAKGPYGTLVGPPTFFYSIFSAGITPGFDGLQAFFGSGKFKIHRLVRRGETIVPTARLADLYEAKGKTASKMVIQVGEVEYRTPQGELLAEYQSKSVRTPRRGGDGGPSYKPRDAYRYTNAELEDIERQVLAQTRRGSAPLFFEDVQVGEDLQTRVKGPLNMATYMAYYAGNLGGAGYVACELQWRLRNAAKTAPDTVPNNRSIGWLIEQTWPGVAHTDNKLAQQVGMPGAYDNGWNRLGWMSQVVTDWAGDKGELTDLEVRALIPNIMGDTLWCHGRVSGKRSEQGKHIVDIELWADNQLGEKSAKGTASVVLPAREG